MNHRLYFQLFFFAVVVCVGCREEQRDKLPVQADEAELEPSPSDPLADELSQLPPHRELSPDDWFKEVTRQSGINFTYSSGRDSLHYTMVESFGGGIALCDFDLDGDLDVFLTGGGTITQAGEIQGAGCRYYRNEGNLQFRDMTAEVGLHIPFDYSHGVAVGDIDNDQFPDLYVTCFGQSRLLHNVDGGKFVDQTDWFTAPPTGWQTAAAFADLNSDSYADLYVAGYLKWEPDPDERCIDPHSGDRDVCMPGSFPGAPDQLYLNSGENSFIQSTEDANFVNDGKGLGVVIADFSEDGTPDIYVANDVVRNNFYVNQGNAKFTETAIVAGNAGNEFGIPEGSMGVDAGDVNGDQRLDIFVTNYELEENSLYINLGNGTFSHQSVPFGLTGVPRPYVGFGTKIADFDNDGWNDIVLVNGHVTYRNRKSDYFQPSLVYRNLNGKRFQQLKSAGPWFEAPHAARGLATGDLDNDGDLDIIVSEQDRPVSVLENRLEPMHWIGLNLMGSRSGTDAIGAKVTLTTETRELVRYKISGGSYLSHSDSRILFPLQERERDNIEIEIEWPSGRIQTVNSPKHNQYNQVVEDEP